MDSTFIFKDMLKIRLKLNRNYIGDMLKANGKPMTNHPNRFIQSLVRNFRLFGGRDAHFADAGHQF